MMKKIQLFFLLLLVFTGKTEAQDVEKYARVHIDINGKSMRDLAKLGIETDHGQITGTGFTTELSYTEIQTVQHAGFKVDIQIPDMTAWFVENNSAGAEDRAANCHLPYQDYKTPANYTYGSMGGYQTLDEIMAVLDDMRAKFPNLISIRKVLSDTIVTHEGRPVWYVKISDHPDESEAETQILYTSLHHAREPNGMSQMLFFMWHLLEEYDHDPLVQYIVDNEELFFIPCVNPDGYRYNQTVSPNGGGNWRKNRRNNGDGTFGVDINRNYGYFWGNDDIGSSPATNAATYRGPAPFSEPETRMIRDFVREHQFTFIQHYHTYSNLLIYPWAYSDTPADPAFIEWAKLFTRDNHYKYGTAIETVGYQVNGDSNDWAYEEKGSYAFTTEIGRTGFWPKQGEIDLLNKENLWTNMGTALSGLRFCVAKDKSPVGFSTRQIEIPVAVKRYGNLPGPFTISIAPLDNHVSSVSQEQTVDLQAFESKDLLFSAQLEDGISAGTGFSLLLSIDNGEVVMTDTLRKSFGGVEVDLFHDEVLQPDKWTGNWGISALDYYSPDFSYTDSPNGFYPPDQTSNWTMKDFAFIPANALNAHLSFWAKWSIDFNDGVQVIALTDDGNETPLCGRYTKIGRNFQPTPGQPMYEEEQPDWVEEYFDLSDFVGKGLKIRFELRSVDNSIAEGFFFDDFKIEYTDPLLLPVQDLQSQPLASFDIQPNPAGDQTNIRWKNSYNSLNTRLLLFNSLGEKVMEAKLPGSQTGTYRLDLEQVPSGVYHCTIVTPEGAGQVKKIVVKH